MSAICVIPARGGSKRIPRKNIRLFHGKPIIAYSIDVALRSRLFDAVLVSTDDAEIAAVARHYSAGVIERPASLADDQTGTQVVITHAIAHWMGTEPDYVCGLYATSPLLNVLDLMRGYEQMRMDPKARYAMSVGYPPLQDAGQFYWGTAMAFMSGHPLVGVYTRMIPLEADQVCDINTEADWQRAEELYRKTYIDNQGRKP